MDRVGNAGVFLHISPFFELKYILADCIANELLAVSFFKRIENWEHYLFFWGWIMELGCWGSENGSKWLILKPVICELIDVILGSLW